MRIYVGGISYSTNSDSLRALFEQHGQVNDVHLVEDQYSGQSKGFGFVEMPNNDEAAKAIASLNGANVSGRTLTVNEARPREERGGGGGRGGYGGGGRSGGGGGGRGGRY